ncbi:hypothetical protein LCGC14_2849610 [marine sediment metagenome]|uniref:Uncharacterized protein n=1 Tax=marine sediment metagenome TaxID=412755 RepID=A0A0F8Y8Y2_9ZZZZ
MNSYIVEFKDGTSSQTYAETEKEAVKFTTEFTNKGERPTKVRLIKTGV